MLINGRAILLFLVSLGFVVEAFAQSQTTGSISGFVQDETRAVLPGVEIQAVHEDRGLTGKTISTDTGSYTIPVLPPGRYTVSFSLPGFQTINNRGIVVNATERVTLNVTMRVSGAGTTIDVSAAAGLVQAETTALGRVIDERLTTSLPLPTKNYTQLLALSPGVVAPLADTANPGRGSINVNVSGARHVGTAFYLDGVDANNIHQNLARENFTGSNGAPVPSTEMIQEFKVQTSQYDAQVGRNAGGSVNVITRSGANEFHGVLYYSLRNEALNANNFFFNRAGLPRPILRQNQAGVTFGGPIKRDKTFFFVGYQWTRQVNAASLANSYRAVTLEPIPEVRTRQTLGPAFGGHSGQLGGIAVMPDGSNINPVALALLNVRLPNGKYAIPSPQRSGAGVNYVESIPVLSRENQIAFNLDHHFSERQRLSFRVFGSDSPQTRPFGSDTLASAASPIGLDYKNRNAVISHVSTISATTMNEARIGWNKPWGKRSNQNPSRTTLQDIGMTRVNMERYNWIPQITVTGQFAIGQGSLYQNINPTTWTYQDTLSLTRGAHLIRAGGELRRHQTYDDTVDANGSINFLSVPDFLLALPAGANGNGSAFSNIQSVSLASALWLRDHRATDLSFFLQDDWKVSPQLTLNLGMRYDYFTFQWDAMGRTSNFDPRRYQLPLDGRQTSAGMVFPKNVKNTFGLPTVNKSLVDKTPNKNFGPRIGFAYRFLPNKSAVLRGGYGIFYDRISNQMILQARGLGSYSSVSATGAEAAFASFQRPFPDLPSIDEHPVLPVIYGPPYNLTRPLRGWSATDPQNATPYLQHYSLNIQSELLPDLLLEIGYVGSKGTHLPAQRWINQALLASPEHPVNGITVNTAANAVLRVPYLGFSANGLRQNQTSSTSRYHSLQASLTKRYSHGLQFLGAYTWAKAMDNFSGGENSTLQGGDSLGDATNQRQMWGTSDYDRKHRFTFSYVYKIPAWGLGLNDTSFGRRFFSGWQVSGVTLLQGGTPVNIADSRGARLYGVTTSRANWAPGATTQTATLSGPFKNRLERYFDTSAFVPSGDYFGNTGRGILRGRGQANVDVSLSKSTRVAEKVTTEWRMEVFNVLNRTNFANPATDIGVPRTFGSIRQTSSNARLIQFGLRILY